MLVLLMHIHLAENFYWGCVFTGTLSKCLACLSYGMEHCSPVWEKVLLGHSFAQTLIICWAQLCLTWLSGLNPSSLAYHSFRALHDWPLPGSQASLTIGWLMFCILPMPHLCSNCSSTWNVFVPLSHTPCLLIKGLPSYKDWYKCCFLQNKLLRLL